MHGSLRTLLVLGLFIEVFSLLPPRKSPPPSPYPQGAIHVLPSAGDAAGSLERIAQAAQQEGLDFLVVAAQDYQPGLAGRYGDVDVYVEMEAHTPAGHALAFFSHTSAKGLEKEAVSKLAWRHYLGLESRPGMFVAVAHPSSVQDPWQRLDKLPDGMELLNLSSQLEYLWDQNPFSLFLSAAIAPFNQYLAAMRFLKLPRKNFQAWDAMNSVSPGHFAFFGHDAPAQLPVRLWGWGWTPYAPLLHMGTNVALIEKDKLSNSPRARQRQIYSALKKGKSAIVFSMIHPFSTNEWTMVCPRATYRSGEEFALREDGCEFVVRWPKSMSYDLDLRLYRDGELEQSAEARADAGVASFPVQADGAYRLEVWARARTAFRVLLGSDVPYLFYNPLYVR